MGRVTNFTIPGGVILATGALLFLAENANHDVCDGGLGQFAQGVSPNMVSQCTKDNTIWAVGIAGMVIGAVLLAVGLSMIRRAGPANMPIPPSTPAGWYPDGTGGIRYWDGVRWTTAWQGPPGPPPPPPNAPP